MVGGISNCSNNSNPDNNNDDNNSSAPFLSDWSTFLSSPEVECSFAVLTSAPCAIVLMLFWRLMYRWVSPQLTKSIKRNMKFFFGVVMVVWRS